MEHYLRSLEDLGRALVAPDPMDRWQAAQELGQHVSVKALDPLLEALRSGRNPLIRWQALESLETVLRALPRRVAEYEVAVRLEALREKAGSPELYLRTAVLLDLSGRVGEAAAEYQRAFLPEDPDPVVLRRWIRLREERLQAFSAAVAARQPRCGRCAWRARRRCRPRAECRWRRRGSCARRPAPRGSRRRRWAGRARRTPSSPRIWRASR
ncbi:HEAT repeat domain-containing protein [Cystobacter fuscus]